MTCVQLKLDDLQDAKLKRAIKHQRGVCVLVTPTQEGDNGQNVGQWILSKKQVEKLHKADVFPTKLTFSAEQIKKNLHHTGGFLPPLAGALLPIIGSAIGGVVEREIAGGNLDIQPVMLSRPGSVTEISPNGKGLYLSPWPGKRPRGYGLYMGDASIKHSNIHHPTWTDSHKKLLKTLL